MFAKYFSGLLARKINKNHATANVLGRLDPYMGTCRFAINLDFLVLSYDCTRISDLKVERITSGYNKLFARLLLIVLAYLKYTLDRAGFANADSTCLPSVLFALQSRRTIRHKWFVCGLNGYACVTK